MATCAAHCAEIERCNQRGGRMLSLVDLLEAGTVDEELAAYLLATVGRGASFMTAAMPGGAGKTTVMGALLNLLPADVPLVPADGLATLTRALAADLPQTCFICHEIGRGPYYAYLWGEPLRAYFQLLQRGHLLATNLHADTYNQVVEQVVGDNGVPESLFERINLLLFLDVNRTSAAVHRRVVEVWEGDGVKPHRRLWSRGQALAASRLVDLLELEQAAARLERLRSTGRRTIAEVRGWLLAERAGD